MHTLCYTNWPNNTMLEFFISSNNFVVFDLEKMTSYLIEWLNTVKASISKDKDHQHCDEFIQLLYNYYTSLHGNASEEISR